MIEKELERFYSTITVDDQVEERVRTAVLVPRDQRSKVKVVAVLAAAAVIVVVAVVWATVRGPHRGALPAHPVPSPTSTPVSSPSPTQDLVRVPAATRNALVGDVVFRGRPLPGARVYIMVMQENDNTPVGKNVPELRFRPALIGRDGAYVIPVPDKVFSPKWSGPTYVNIEVDIFSPRGGVLWFTPLRRHGHSTAPTRITFDLGRRTVTVNGQTDNIQVT